MAKLEVYAKPQSLHRYRPLGIRADRELNALAEGYIYCPVLSDMNDPMEGMHRLSLRLLDNPSGEKRQQQIQAALARTGIASLSEVYDHEPMWAHYADQFKGMCIQYSLNRLLKGLDDDVAIARMMYSEQAPVMLDDKSSAAGRARLCLSSKTVRWSSEREWRVFRSESGQARYSPLNTVTKVFLGARVSAEDEAKVRRVGRLLNIPIAKMEIHSYAMAFSSPKKLNIRAAERLGFA